MSKVSVSIDFAFDEEIDGDVFGGINYVEKEYAIKGEIVTHTGPSGWPVVRWIGSENLVRKMMDKEYDDFDGSLFETFRETA